MASNNLNLIFCTSDRQQHTYKEREFAQATICKLHWPQLHRQPINNILIMSARVMHRKSAHGDKKKLFFFEKLQRLHLNSICFTSYFQEAPEAQRKRTSPKTHQQQQQQNILFVVYSCVCIELLVKRNRHIDPRLATIGRTICLKIHFMQILNFKVPDETCQFYISMSIWVTAHDKVYVFELIFRPMRTWSQTARHSLSQLVRTKTECSNSIFGLIDCCRMSMQRTSMA